MQGLKFLVPLFAVGMLATAGQAQEGIGTNLPQLIPGNDTQELCRLFAAERCINHMWTAVDADDDTMLSAVEIDSFVERMKLWSQRSDKDFGDRAVIKVAMMVYGLTGTDRLIASYDADGDGMLSQDEAFADVDLEGRTIAEVMYDNGAINSDQLAERFGFLAPQMVRLAQAAGNRLAEKRGGDVTAIASAIEAEGEEQASTDQ